MSFLLRYIFWFTLRIGLDFNDIIVLLGTENFPPEPKVARVPHLGKLFEPKVDEIGFLFSETTASPSKDSVFGHKISNSTQRRQFFFARLVILAVFLNFFEESLVSIVYMILGDLFEVLPVVLVSPTFSISVVSHVGIAVLGLSDILGVLFEALERVQRVHLG